MASSLVCSCHDERRDILDSARADARHEIKAVRQELRRLRERWTLGLQSAQTSAPEETPSLRELDSETRETLTALEKSVSEEQRLPPPKAKYRGPLQAGDQVWVEPYQALGEVISSRQGEIEVQLGRFRASVKRNQVELHQPSDEAKLPHLGEELEVGSVHTPVVESPGFELDLRGNTTEEALHQLDRYLDDAYLVGLPWVRIIHGKGTGALRAAVRDALRVHSLVTSYEAGKEGEGGDGVTVAKLAVEN